MSSTSIHTDTKQPLSAALRELLVLAAPTAATMVSYSLAQFVDGRFVSELGAEEFAAHGNGSIFAYALIAVVMGVLTVINTYVSQHLGAGRPERSAAYAWNGLWMGAIFWLAVLVPVGLFIGPITTGLAQLIDLITANGGRGLAFTPEAIALQNEYARVLFLGAVAVIWARAISHFFFGLHRPGVILVASVIGNGVNVLANWILIFDEIPLLGVAGGGLGLTGAALGTVIGTAVEFAIPLVIFLGPTLNRQCATRTTWPLRLKPIRDIFKTGWPAGLMFGNEIVCWWVLLAIIIGGISPADNAAGWIGLRYMQLSFMPAVGLSIAITAVVGRAMGANRPDLAVRRAWIGVSVGMVYMGLCAAAFFLFREPLVRFFISEENSPEMSAEILRIGTQVMIAAAIFQVFDAIGICLAGALRGAGDTVWPGVATMFLSWSVLIGGGYAMAVNFPDLRSIGPWIAGAAYIILFALFMLTRFLMGSWKQIELVDRENLPDPILPDASAQELAAMGCPSFGDFDDATRDLAERLDGAARPGQGPKPTPTTRS